MKVRIQITGTAPLLMHNVRLANPLDPVVKAMKQISSKRIKTDEDLEDLARLEFEGGLYFADDIGPYLPGENVEKCLVEGGRITKQGKKIERGLFVLDNEIPLIYKGPRTIEALWANEDFRNVKAVKVGQARVMRTRPLFREWAVEADCEVDGAILNLADLESLAVDAGSMVGLGDYRPRYGRFTTSIAKL